MKKILKYLAATGIAVAMTVDVRSQGYIVANGVTSAGFNGVGYGVNVIYDPPDGFATGFYLDPNGKTPPSSPYVNTFKFDPIVDVGVRVFLVSSGDTISTQTILGGNYAELTSPNSYIFNNDVPVYVGLYTGNQSFAPPNGIYSDPLFGWAELENVNGTIELINSALEYQGGGIIAGTDTILPIPEPATWTLLLCGVGLLGVVRNFAGKR